MVYDDFKLILSFIINNYSENYEKRYNKIMKTYQSESVKKLSLFYFVLICFERMEYMKTVMRKSVKVISSKEPLFFEKSLNECLGKLADEGITDYELRFNDSMGLCAYVVYNIRELVPVTLSEKARAEGRACECGDCINFVVSDDGRKKWHYCKYKNEPARVDHDACDYFYQYGFDQRKQINEGGIRQSESKVV